MKVFSKEFFSFYVLHPLAKELSLREKRMAVITSVVLGIFSLGFYHLICALAFRNKKVNVQPLQKNNAQKVALNALPVLDEPKKKLKDALVNALPHVHQKKVMSDLVEKNKHQILDIAKKLHSIPKKGLDTDIKMDGVKFYKGHLWAFELKEIPGVIFKMPPNSAQEMNFFKQRCNNIKIAQKVCENNKSLKNIIIPNVDFIKEDNIELLAEEKLDFAATGAAQASLYEFCAKDPDLKETVKDYLLQLVIFICETGLSDLNWENFPLLNDGSGIGLYDLEDMSKDCPEAGLKTLITKLPSDEIFEAVKHTLKQQFPDIYAKLKF